MKELNDVTENSAQGIPRISIGMPVFNGAKYLQEALDSILAQTYPDFELIIVDNASTDNTSEICHFYADKDSRIRYYRNKRNIGATRNHNKVFKLAKGEFFKWAAHDDILAPDFLLKCIKIFNQDLSLVLCHSTTGRINEHGELIGSYNFPRKIISRKPYERYGAIIEDRAYARAWFLIFGLIRASSLRRTSLFGNFVGADQILLAELGLMGRMYEIPEFLFFRRIHPKAYGESKRTLSSREILKWWTQAGGISFPNVKIFFEYIRLIRRVTMKFFERFLCYVQTFKWFLERGFILICVDVVTNLLIIFQLESNFQAFALAIAKRINFSEE